MEIISTKSQNLESIMKKDKALGQRVKEHLLSVGVETPMADYGISNVEKLKTIEENFTKIMYAIGLDLRDDSLQDTPKRVAKMFVEEVFYGLDYENFPKATAVENKMSYDEMVICKDVSIQSHCEYYFVNIDGKAVIGYIPAGKVLGLSKINRIAKFFSKRPQIQERLTEQIFYALCLILETDDVAVIIKATHHCVKSRGVEDEGSETITSKLGGSFKNDTTRAELLSLLK